jgi:hypothetical protein
MTNEPSKNQLNNFMKLRLNDYFIVPIYNVLCLGI